MMGQAEWERMSKELKKMTRRALAERFYDSEEWLRLRYDALLRSAGTCDCCGCRPSKFNPLQVDHIKPRSKYPKLALEPTNLQVLCKQCNIGKGNSDETDWRWK